MTVMNNIESIKDTTLWKKLNDGFKGENEEIARILSTNLFTICKNAASRMKRFPSLHPQYTLHDEVHLLRVTEIMAMIISEDVLNILNPIEITLLILASFFHDQGMILDDNERLELNNNNEFKLFKENWIIDHPNFSDIQSRVNDRNFSSEEKGKCIRIYNELQDALLTDFIRINHGEAAKKYVNSQFSNDSMWEINSINLASYVGKLCKSHNEDIKNINETNGFNLDENIVTYKVNMQFLSIILRLADILDFDRDRTPDSIYKTIHFSNDVSLIEWEKHRSVYGWEINKNIIRFTMKCKHPIYHRAALQFMDWIDEELINSHNLINKFPAYVGQYKLEIPTMVDRSRIEAKDNCYIYHDLEFSLSRDNIVKLLMTESLYESTSICIRELLQNSLDALRHRKCIFKRDLGIEWNDGKVKFKHEIDEYGREVVTCEDNGIGMDEKIITRFLTKVGRSYYKSPEFLKDKESLSSVGINFEPCSQFGIGFMSCFMLGDTIILKTRRDYGYSVGKGKPLVVEINGLNGSIVIKNGEEGQEVGTSIKIIGRNKPPYLDSWEDKVRLIEVLNGYALACEFKIEGECSIDEIKGNILIPNEVAIPKTFIEKLDLNKESYKTFEQNLSKIDNNLNGIMRVSLLVDENGKFTLENDEAKWDNSNPKERNKFIIKKNTNKSVNMHELDKTCCDGILVCGTPGRDNRRSHLGWWANVLNSGIESFIVDIRGSIKPRLTPSRVPKEDRFNLHPSWKRIQEKVDIAQGMLWEKILSDLNTKEELETFLKLVTIYRVQLSNIPQKNLWNRLYIPFKDLKEGLDWIKLSDVSKLKVSKDGVKIKLYLDKEKILETPQDLKLYDEPSRSSISEDNIVSALIGMSSISIENSEVFLNIEEPDYHIINISIYKIVSVLTRVVLLKYNGEADKFIVIQTSFCSANRNNPLVKYVFENRFSSSEDLLTQFIQSLIIFLQDKKEVLDIINDRVSGRMHRLGCLYNAIRWEEYNEDLKPIYRIWTSTEGELDMVEDDFKKWSQTKPYDLVVW